MKSKTFNCFIESLLYTTAVYLVFFHFSSFKYSFLAMNLHPLLIVIAVISLKYGTYMSGFVVSFSIIYYILAYIGLGRDMIIFFSSFEYYKFILMFFFTALFLGKLRDTTDQKIMHLEGEVSKTREDYEKQKENNVKLITINSRLKKRIISSRESIVTLNQIKSSFANMNVEQIYTEAILVMRQFLESDVVSIYSFNHEKNFMRLKLRAGNGRIPGFLQVKKDSVFDEVIKAGAPMEFPLDIEGDSPIFVSPIKNNDEILGFINIERMSLEASERYSYEMFKIITHWLNEALSEAFVKEEKEIKENYLKDTKIFTMGYFNKIMSEEERRKKLLGMDFMAFETKIEGVTPDEVAEMIKGKVRESDFMAMDDNKLRILFPATTAASKELLMEKIASLFHGIEVDFYEI
ncbi:hypothetical protein [Ilyobacter polytropus]|uniref:GAF domain-containing protein n=1 Tax=Ilyobacter polytropus (strain ATCC 51220 / DSM 2926 / LMG 16218 / CuHBu1) TaxID=572544 RepID=E3H9C3_ILYPC|nr:hypothetical protein [Ilyobacter polytropus]ADO83032.1 hypothetical protein Ilyop_1251 [Ilyobacter polytropus DSM 2926]